MATATKARWQMSGQGYEFCNCDFGCGCNFGGFPNSKDGSCRALVGFSVTKGRCGDTDLAGVKGAGIFVWPKAIHEGNGKAAFIVEPATTDKQVEVLSQIFTGQLGGLPWELLGPTFQVAGLVKAKISIEGSGRKSTFRIDGVGEGRGDTLKDPVTGEDHIVNVDLPTGFIWKKGEAGQGSFRASAAGLSVEFNKTNFIYTSTTGRTPPDAAAARAMSDAALETLLRRDRVILGAALAVITVAAWLYLRYLASAMSDMAMPGMSTMPGMAMAMPSMHPWSSVEVGVLVVMWTVMMIAMMTPAATPMILMFATIHRRRTAEGRPAVATAIFILGYLAVWTTYSVVAALAQTGLHAAALLSPDMAAMSPLLAGGLLVAAGVFQWTPLKRACLAACRSPLSFLMTAWREGRAGAFVMGFRHGLYCLGCCWALMALLFVAGVMNLLWVAAIAVVVLVEKVVPRGDLVGRLAGVVFVAAGGLLVARGFIG